MRTEMNDYESEAINHGDYVSPSVNITDTDIRISGDIQIFDRTEVGNQVEIDYIEREIDKKLEKYDLTYEELEAFIEKYEPERLI